MRQQFGVIQQCVIYIYIYISLRSDVDEGIICEPVRRFLNQYVCAFCICSLYIISRDRLLHIKMHILTVHSW